MALDYSDWDKLSGYDERMYGWGYEDTDLYIRAKEKIKLIEPTEYALFHINHPSRGIEPRGDQNQSIYRTSSPWHNSSWGL